MKRFVDKLKSLFLKLPSSAAVPVQDAQPDAVDDPDYDVENVTPDDEELRADPDPLPPAEVEEVFKAMTPVDLWRRRQQQLKAVGFDPGPIDGKPGSKTQKAVKAFQDLAGLEPDGAWGPKTQRAMEERLLPSRDGGANLTTPRPPKYEEMVGATEFLDAAFWRCFVDLTQKSNVVDEKGRHRRKGVRKHSALKREVWHQTSFSTWLPHLVLMAKQGWSNYHKINAHVCFDTDTDGSIILVHNFFYYLHTANHFNPDCLSFEVMGNFEGVLGAGNWYKPEKFGRGRPSGMQLVRCRQFKLWLLDPELGPKDEDLPKPLLEWRLGCRKHGNPLKWSNAHREGTDGRGLDCGSELWYHVVYWGFETTSITHGPKRGNGEDIPDAWWQKPAIPPLPFGS